MLKKRVRVGVIGSGTEKLFAPQRTSWDVGWPNRIAI